MSKNNSNNRQEPNSSKHVFGYMSCHAPLFVCLIGENKLTWGLYGLLGAVILLYIILRERRLRKDRQQLRKEKDLLQTLMDNIPDRIYFKDKNSRFIRVNNAKADEIGLNDPSEAIGNSDFEYFDQQDATEAYNDEQKIISTGRPLINKVEKRKNNKGEDNWFSATKVPIVNNKNGKIMGTVGITRNITKQILAEKKLANAKKKAEEADQLKSTFLANMSHEIRTPMNAILGFSDLLTDPDISEEEKTSYIQHIKDNGNVLLKLIDDIIDISKIESNEITIVNKSFNVNQLLKELYTYYHKENQKMNEDEVDLRLVEDDHELVLNSDKIRVKQVLSNLLSNAIKFTNKGTIEFGYVKEHRYIHFYVKDTGIGIEDDKKEQIFDRFGHFDERMKKNIAGTGLGLSISKYLAELLGGNIKVKSTPGEGSIFYFTLEE